MQEHAPSSANSELMLANHSSTSCPEPLPTAHSSFVSAGTSLSLEAQEAQSQSIICFTIFLTYLRPIYTDTLNSYVIFCELNLCPFSSL